MHWADILISRLMLAIDWCAGVFALGFKIIVTPIDLRSNYPGGEDWRASGGAADVRRRMHLARSLTGRRVGGMICSGDLGSRRLMLVG